MENVTAKYHGKNGYEGCIISFKIKNYHINLESEVIGIKYDMLIFNSIDTNEITRITKSYNLKDTPAIIGEITTTISEPVLDQYGEVITEGVYETTIGEISPAKTEFSDYQNFSLQYGVDNGLNTLEEVFFINTFVRILSTNGYTDMDLV